jgi:hypothetical protein
LGDDRLLRKAIQTGGVCFAGGLFLDTSPGQIDVEEEEKDPKSNYRGLICISRLQNNWSCGICIHQIDRIDRALSSMCCVKDAGKPAPLATGLARKVAE